MTTIRGSRRQRNLFSEGLFPREAEGREYARHTRRMYVVFQRANCVYSKKRNNKLKTATFAQAIVGMVVIMDPPYYISICA